MGSTRSPQILVLALTLGLAGGPLVSEVAAEEKPQGAAWLAVTTCDEPQPGAAAIAARGDWLYLVGPGALPLGQPECRLATLETPGAFLPIKGEILAAGSGAIVYRVSLSGGGAALASAGVEVLSPQTALRPGAPGPARDGQGRFVGVRDPGGDVGPGAWLGLTAQIPELEALPAFIEAGSSPARILVSGDAPEALGGALRGAGLGVDVLPWPAPDLPSLARSGAMAGAELAVASEGGRVLIAPALGEGPRWSRLEGRLLAGGLWGLSLDGAEEPAGVVLAILPIYKDILDALARSPGAPDRARTLTDAWGSLGERFQDLPGLSPLGRARLLGMRGAVALLLSQGAPALRGDQGGMSLWLARAEGDLAAALALVGGGEPALEGALRGDRALIASLDPARGDEGLRAALAEVRRAQGLLPREGDMDAWAALKWTEGVLLGRLAGHGAGTAAGAGEEGPLEQSREAFGWALNRFTPTGDRGAYGAVTLGMGEALIAGARGDRRLLLQGVEALHRGLSALTPEESPVVVAWGLIHLMEASAQIPFAEEGEIIERAIRGGDVALTLLTPEDAPYAWATVQRLRGYAYQIRLLGNRDERVDTAIEAYEAALTVFTQEAFPEAWASTTVNLAGAWLQRAGGDPDANNARARALLEAVLAYGEALGDARLRSTALNNLGLAWLRRGGGDRLENVERAGVAFGEALKGLDEVRYPEDVAQTQANLEIAEFYRAAEQLARGNPGTSRAIAALGDAYLLEGLEYREWLILTEGEDRFRQSVDAYQAAIQLRPDIGLHHHKRSVALWKLLEVQEALGEEREALKLDPENPVYLSWLLFLEAQERLLKDPTSGPGHLKMGRFHLTHWELPEALASFQRAWKADRSLLAAPAEMARIYVHLDNPEAGLRIAQEGLTVAPTSMELLAIAHSISFEILHDFPGALPFAEAMARLVTEPDPALRLTLLENRLAAGDLKAFRGGDTAAAGMAPAEVMTLRALEWLERLAAGRRSKREAAALMAAYDALPEGAEAPWSYGGLTYWAGEALGSEGARAQGVLKILAEPKTGEGGRRLKEMLGE